MWTSNIGVSTDLSFPLKFQISSYYIKGRLVSTHKFLTKSLIRKLSTSRHQKVSEYSTSEFMVCSRNRRRRRTPNSRFKDYQTGLYSQRSTECSPFQLMLKDLSRRKYFIDTGVKNGFETSIIESFIREITKLEELRTLISFINNLEVKRRIEIICFVMIARITGRNTIAHGKTYMQLGTACRSCENQRAIN